MNLPATLPVGELNSVVQQANMLVASKCGVVITDVRLPDTPVVYVNDAFVEITGYAREEILGRNCRMLQGSDRDQPVLDEVRQAIKTGTSCTVLLRNYRKNGDLFWNELALMPIRDDSGEVTHFVGIQKDGSLLWDELFMAPIIDEESGQVTYYIGIQSDVRARDLARQQVIEKQREVEEANAKITALNSQLTKENLRLGAELEVTRRLQQMILPREEELKAVSGLDIAGYMEPANEVGGDYYDVLHRNGAVKIGIGDVTDHGLESGVVMLMTQTAVRTLLNSGETDPIRFMDILNRTVYGNVKRMRTDRNLTLSLVDYISKDKAGGQMRLSGQHEKMIVARRNGCIEIIDTANLGFPIGLDDNVADFIDHVTLDLHPGDGFVLFTDGITEAENEDDEQFGIERLCHSIQTNWRERSETIKEAIITDLHAFIGKQEVYDDITLLVVKQE